jgi:hypothetical protein
VRFVPNRSFLFRSMKVILGFEVKGMELRAASSIAPLIRALIAAHVLTGRPGFSRASARISYAHRLRPRL